MLNLWVMSCHVGQLKAALAELEELRGRLRKCDTEQERVRLSDASHKQQVASLENSVAQKNGEIDAMRKQIEADKAAHEDKIVYLQMQLNSLKGKGDSKDKEASASKATVDKLTAQLAVMQRLIEEKDTSLKSTKEMIQNLQARVIEMEPELMSGRDKIATLERNLTAQNMMKAEQTALTNSLRSNLKSTLEELEGCKKRTKELEEFKVKADGQLLKLASLSEQAQVLQSAVEDKDSLITRLRSEQQVSRASFCCIFLHLYCVLSFC
jgi:chromosome segregation ATPase